MAGLIPQTFIDDLISRADIVEIVGARVPLKKKGKEHSACCPFHNEKTPSFTVSENKQFYHCFGCGAHGTALGFLMEYENLEFVDAVETLAAEYNLDVPHEQTGRIHQQSAGDNRKPLYEALDKVTLLFQQQLKTSDKAIQYLKQRGVTGEVAKNYKLGYAPDGWDFLTQKFKDNIILINNLCSLGLLIKKDNGQHYDRFRDRIIFPITDRRGRVIGFGGRIIDQGEPKYLNSPENPIFHKGLELYGVFEAKQAVRNLERIIIVEGYMDVVALAQNNIAYAVASLGTATTKEQIQKTFRATQEIIFCYDGDAAGTKAAWRALENTLSIIRDGQVAKFLFLPEKEDPDSMVRKEGKENFEKRLDAATPLSDFLFDNLKQKTDISSDDGKAKLFELSKPLLSSMNDSLFKDLLTDKLSALVGISAERISKRLPEASEKKLRPALNSQRIEKKIHLSTIRKTIALLLQNPTLAKTHCVPDGFSKTEIQGFSLLYQIHNQTTQNPEITTAALLERFRDSEEEIILHKLVKLEIPGADDSQQRDRLYSDYINDLKSRLDEAPLAARQTELENKSKSGKLTPEEKQEYNQLISS
jgi:DNA primase